jgi:hypothetical protein
MNLMIK